MSWVKPRRRSSISWYIFAYIARFGVWGWGLGLGFRYWEFSAHLNRYTSYRGTLYYVILYYILEGLRFLLRVYLFIYLGDLRYHYSGRRPI
ncbi:hypothetical protein F4809DRAFT_586603 [Biscogniauxia mediterranea]|nr:hypothetical protein F4809DRAFT_586603 [Biscogniauxia mediterranea]